MTDRDLMQQALDALKTCRYRPNEFGGEYLHYDEDEVDEAVTALTKRLAQPEQEPVAMYEDWYNTKSCGHCGMVGGHAKSCRHYTTPPAAQRQHVTDGSPCWCEPETSYTDPETGASVIVHKGPQ